MRRIITGLRLDKIAAVTRPCQEEALATIMKSHPEAPALLNAAPGGGEGVSKEYDGIREQIEKLAADVGCAPAPGSVAEFNKRLDALSADIEASKK